MPGLHIVKDDKCANDLEVLITTLHTWPRVQQQCLVLTTYAAQHREAFGQQLSFMSSAQRAVARNGYTALLETALGEFQDGSLEAEYIRRYATRMADYYAQGYGPK